MTICWVLCAAVCLLLAVGCGTTATKRLGLAPLRTVEHVDLQRYLGTWYEIASFPQRFQAGCTGTSASYTLDAGGTLRVVNRCRKGSLAGEEKSVQGKARVVDKETNAKLKVTFFWPFWGDYWIIDLDPDYQYAAVGHPSRDYLWILARQPTMALETFSAIVERLRQQGYEVERLEKTLQPPSAAE